MCRFQIQSKQLKFKVVEYRDKFILGSVVQVNLFGEKNKTPLKPSPVCPMV